MSSFRTECLIRDAHIDRKATELVRGGFPPYTAIRIAAQQVDEEAAEKRVESTLAELLKR